MDALKDDMTTCSEYIKPDHDDDDEEEEGEEETCL